MLKVLIMSAIGSKAMGASISLGRVVPQENALDGLPNDCSFLGGICQRSLKYAGLENRECLHGSLNKDHDAIIFLRQRSSQPQAIAVLKPMEFSAAHISDTILVRNPVLKDTTRPWSVTLPSSTGFGDCPVW